MSIDPMYDEYPFFTPYQFAGNDVIAATDVDGLEPAYDKGNGVYTTARDGALQRPISDIQFAQLNAKAQGHYDNSGDKAALSIALDLIPAVGTVKNWIEAGTGEDLITGDKIPTWARWASIVPYGKIAAKGKILLKNSDALIKAVGKGVKVVNKLPCGCFTEETKIATANGYKEIRDIVIGDSVWSYNEKNKALELRKVINTLQVKRDSLFLIHFNGHVLEVTSDHPFYIGGRWLEVNKLRIGDSLTLFDNKKIVINDIKILKGSFDVYNFEVEGFHNYFVSKSKVLVHNGVCDVVTNGFYKIVRDGEIIYIGKGKAGRAATSLKKNSGDAAEFIQVSEGVAGQNVVKTAFIFEHLLMEEAVKAGAVLKNLIASPGAKYFEKLSPEAKKLFRETFEKIKSEAPQIIEKK